MFEFVRLNKMFGIGTGGADEFVSTGRALPEETRAYVAALAPLLGAEPLPEGASAAPPVPADWRDAPLFVMRLDGANPAAFAQPDGTAATTPAAPPKRDSDADPASEGGLFVSRPGLGDRP